MFNKNSTWYKTVRAAVFSALSVAVAALVNSLTGAIHNDPTLFGAWTVAINAILVLVKNWLIDTA